MNPTDPLAALRPIHLPPPIGWWPPAPGWWILAAAALAALLTGGAWLLRHRRRNRYRRAALAELDALRAAFVAQADHALFVTACNQLLRRAALCRYPAAGVAHLTGAAWLAFLDRSGRTDAFVNGAGRVLAEAPYAPAPDCDAPALEHACRAWLRRHR